MSGEPSGEAFRAQHSDYLPGNVSGFDAFALFWLGEKFEHLPLMYIQRTLDPREEGEAVRANHLHFIYGDCDPAEGGCAFPLVVQVWPACERNLSTYRLSPGGSPLPHERDMIRGVPAAWFGDTRLELYSGDVTIVLFSLDEVLLARAAQALVPANELATLEPDGALPPPAIGAMEGDLQCGKLVEGVRGR
jgi:hypothetical protein